MSVVKLPSGPLGDSIAARLAALERDDVPRRLWKRDPTLWSADPDHQAVARNRLGWLALPQHMQDEVASIEAFARDVQAEGLTHAVLLGMGGSSLAPEVLAQMFGSESGAGSARGLILTVLDTTSPAAVRAVGETHDPNRTLFIVSSKSGGTIEVATLERHFHEWVRAARGEERGRSFIAITDPGTALERLAQERKYRRVFSAPADVGGRYSALTYFGMVPGALAGVPIAKLLAHAVTESQVCGGSTPAAQGSGYVLGAALGTLALAGRNKLTLVLGEPFEPFGPWVEQLVAESTGKSGKGIVPIVGEPLGEPHDYGDDRVFVAFSAAALSGDTTKKLQALERAGHPVLTWRDPEIEAVGAEFLRWEIATATAAVVLGVDPFDEPNVAEAKQTTKATLDQYLREGRFPDGEPVAASGDVFVEAPSAIAQDLRGRVPATSDPAAWAAALLGSGNAGDYFALLAYFYRTPARNERLERLRRRARDSSRLATTTGYGPRYLHSTGQLHKGGPNTGVFLQLTADEGDDAAIPGERHGFASLIRAQASGDFQVLERHGRRVVRVHLGAQVEAALDRLIEAFGAKVQAT